MYLDSYESLCWWGIGSLNSGGLSVIVVQVLMEKRKFSACKKCNKFQVVLFNFLDFGCMHKKYISGILVTRKKVGAFLNICGNKTDEGEIGIL